jgi:hypothetical protein
MLLQATLHKVSGSEPLEAQVRRLMPDVHAFGHTHLNMDLTLDGIRYVQWPLGTPREQRAQTRVSSFGLMCVYDGASGGETPQHWTHWGRHYEEFERDLTKTARPPYVTKVMESFSGAFKQARSTWGHEQSLQHAAGASSVGTSEIAARRSYGLNGGGGGSGGGAAAAAAAPSGTYSYALNGGGPYART